MNDTIPFCEGLFINEQNTCPVLDSNIGDIIFNVGGSSEEILRINSNGDFLVRGKIVTNDIEIYDGMKEWFAFNQYTKA